MTWLWREIDHLRAQWDVDEHIVHVRWREGELEPADFAAYASELDHAVVALATASRGLAAEAPPWLEIELDALAADHHRAIAQWRAFAASVGWHPGVAWHYAADPTPETVRCARVWTGAGRPFAERVVALYAIAPGCARLVGRDRAAEHAATLRGALALQLAAEDAFALARRAQAALCAHWELLDGVQRLTSGPRTARPVDVVQRTW